ncbi:MAG: hypothetical protein H8E37_02955 [Planctomycetes bacterium]|nr:hypothetical protein [Planctomycetota bacterium]
MRRVYRKGRSWDPSILERLGLAVESIVVGTDLSTSLSSAYLSIVPLNPNDFPTEELEKMFIELMERHQQSKEKARIQESHLDFDGPNSLRYVFMCMHSRTKHWYKVRIWELYRGSVCELHAAEGESPP